MTREPVRYMCDACSNREKERTRRRARAAGLVLVWVLSALFLPWPLTVALSVALLLGLIHRN